jgi:hypothetical protein
MLQFRSATVLNAGKKELAHVYSVAACDRKASAGFYTWPSVPYFKAVFSNQANLIPA